MNSKRSCPICYSSSTLHQLPCTHSFCLPCIRQWAKSATNACPICRKTFHKIQTKSGHVHRFKDTEINFDDTFYDNDEEVDLYDGEHCVICGDLEDQQRKIVFCSSCEGVTVHLDCVGAKSSLKNWKCSECQNIDERSEEDEEQEDQEEQEGTASQPELFEDTESSDCSFYPWMEVGNFSEVETRHTQNVRSQILGKDGMISEFKEDDGRVMTRNRLQNLRKQRALQFGSLISLADSVNPWEDQPILQEPTVAVVRRHPRMTVEVTIEESKENKEPKRGGLSRQELQMVQDNQNLLINGSRDNYQKHSMVLRSHRKN